jgi:hypothetical protein
MKRIALLCLLLGAVLAWQAPRTNAQVASQNGGIPSTAGPLVLYDDFHGPRIDPNKWYGIWGDFSDAREMVRDIAWQPGGQGNDRALRVFLRSYANTWDDWGGLGGGYGLNFTSPATVKEVAFTVTVRGAQATTCSSNPGGMAAAVAELRGAFFNDGTGGAGSIGDVIAVISVNRFGTDTTNALTVSGFYTRCDDEYCGAQTYLGGGTLGYVNPGQPVRLRVKWDQPNHQFVFRMNGQPPLVSPYTVSDANPPSYGGWKYIGLTRILPNCTTSPRPQVMVDAYFSDVYVNAQ